MKPLNFALCVVLSTLAGLGSAQTTCTNASVHGTFGLINTAGLGSGIGAGIGQITFDGVGKATSNSLFISYTLSGWNGSGGGPSTGTYTVSSDCTGTVSLTDDPGGKVTNFNFVVDNLGTGGQFVQTFHSSGTFVQIGSLTAQGINTCGLDVIKRTFAANLSGTVVGTGSVGYVGKLTLDTGGNITGSLTLNVNGTVTDVSGISGTYTQGKNCIGTATITVGGSTMNFNFVVVRSGTELLLLETDTDTVVSGNAQM